MNSVSSCGTLAGHDDSSNPNGGALLFATLLPLPPLAFLEAAAGFRAEDDDAGAEVMTFSLPCLVSLSLQIGLLLVLALVLIDIVVRCFVWRQAKQRGKEAPAPARSTLRQLLV